MTENLKLISREKCFVCGAGTSFQIENDATLYREARCALCGASKRNSDIARALVSVFTGGEGSSLSGSLVFFEGLHIYEAASSGKIHDLLKKVPNYICSEFYDNVPRGAKSNGVRCEDLAHLTFSDNSFDLVITQDVIEHVSDHMKAFHEIKRVLKPGGYHIFTVPLHEGRQTVIRAVFRNGEIVNTLSPVYHGDPLREEGALVYTDFGDDIAAMLNTIGMATKIITYSKWYSPDEITIVDNGESYSAYLVAYRNKEQLSFFKYNSVTLISQKRERVFTGERYIPGIGGQIAYEHLHRYALARDYVSGKTVLDIACGEGYGSNLLAKTAKRVVGVDISEDAISHAKMKYGNQKNLEYYMGSCVDIPCSSETFDVVVSFETIEHIEEHKKMLDEVKRVLKPGGTLIISTPNRKTYTDDTQLKNEYHVREFYLSEFTSLLHSGFKHVNMMGQRLTLSSHIWPLEENPEGTVFTHYSGDDSYVNSSISAPFEALYFIAICTDAGNPEGVNPKASLFTEKSDQLYAFHYNKLPILFSERERQLSAVYNSWIWRITAPMRKIMELLKK